MVRWSIPVVPGRHRSSHQVCLHALLSHFLISWLDNASSARTIGHTGNERKACTIVLPKKTAFIFEQQSLASKLGIKHL